MTLTVIGHVTTAFEDPATTPIQAQRDVSQRGRVHVDEPYRGGLEGLGGFDYALLITYLHRSTRPEPGPAAWKVVPFLLAATGREFGTFATRHPGRPNPIGVSLVRIFAIRDDGFEFAGVDLVNQTPLLDIKPWLPEFDTPRTPSAMIRTGWYQPAVLAQEGTTPIELRQAATRPTTTNEDNQ